MPKIYELLGYPVDDNSPAVIESRKQAYCPFISDLCDGGGNRFMSDIDLREHDELKELFPGLTLAYVPFKYLMIHHHGLYAPVACCIWAKKQIIVF